MLYQLQIKIFKTLLQKQNITKPSYSAGRAYGKKKNN